MQLLPDDYFSLQQSFCNPSRRKILLIAALLLLAGSQIALEHPSMFLLGEKRLLTLTVAKYPNDLIRRVEHNITNHTLNNPDSDKQNLTPASEKPAVLDINNETEPTNNFHQSQQDTRLHSHQKQQYLNSTNHTTLSKLKDDVLLSQEALPKMSGSNMTIKPNATNKDLPLPDRKRVEQPSNPKKVANTSDSKPASVKNQIHTSPPKHQEVSSITSKSYQKLLVIKNQTTLELGVVQGNGILDLLPWELQSIHDYKNETSSTGGSKLTGTCQTPPGVHSTCCPGSFSSGGSVSRKWAHHCFKGNEVYDRAAQTILEQLERTNAMVNEECDICRIVEILHQRQLRFAIMGDSMMSQTVDGFYCELLRRGYNVTRINIELPDRNAMTGLKEIWTHEISGPKHWQSSPVTVTYLFQYKPHANMIQMQTIATSYDVLMMNFGLHFINGRHNQAYEDIMGRIFNVMRQGNITLLAHRETSAQHNNHTGGEWGGGGLSDCVPLNYEKDAAITGWRERVVQAKAKEVGYNVVVADETLPPTNNKTGEKELVILPFFNLTASLHYLHPSECTHYCSTPYLWMPIWRGLRLAMDRRWSTGTLK